MSMVSSSTQLETLEGCSAGTLAGLLRTETLSGMTGRLLETPADSLTETVQEVDGTTDSIAGAHKASEENDGSALPLCSYDGPAVGSDLRATSQFLRRISMVRPTIHRIGPTSGDTKERHV